MKTYTYNEVRTTLFKIIQNVFSPTFVRKYEDNIDRYSHSIDRIMLENSDRIDSLVRQYSLCTDFPASCEAIAVKQSAKMLCALYMRYYLISNYLMQQPQDDTIEFPESEGEFFSAVLITFWQTVLKHF